VSKQTLIQFNIENILEKIDKIIVSSRSKQQKPVQLMAVTKNAGIEEIVLAQQAGITLFGENYIQNAVPKLHKLFQHYGMFPSMFHFIGHLQSNKLSKAMEYFSNIQTVDSIPLAQKISAKAASEGRIYPVFLEVNTSGETEKFGFSPYKFLQFVDKIVFLEKIAIVGLMTMGPLNGDEHATRSSFAQLRKLKDEMELRLGLNSLLLSMGMSDDFESAIMEGTDLIRIGRGIFGEESVANE
jgi:PLP dependent protein